MIEMGQENISSTGGRTDPHGTDPYQPKALENENGDERGLLSTLYTRCTTEEEGYSCYTQSQYTMTSFFDPKYLSWHRVQAQNKNLCWDFSALSEAVNSSLQFSAKYFISVHCKYGHILTVP